MLPKWSQFSPLTGKMCDIDKKVYKTWFYQKAKMIMNWIAQLEKERLQRLSLRKIKKRLARWTNSNWKCKKMSSTVVNHRNKGSKGDMEQTTFSQYKNTAPVVNRVQGLRDHSHQERLKKQWPPVHIYHFDHMLKSKYLHGKIQTRTSQIS